MCPVAWHNLPWWVEHHMVGVNWQVHSSSSGVPGWPGSMHSPQTHGRDKKQKSEDKSPTWVKSSKMLSAGVMAYGDSGVTWQFRVKWRNGVLHPEHPRDVHEHDDADSDLALTDSTRIKCLQNQWTSWLHLEICLLEDNHVRGFAVHVWWTMCWFWF